MAIVLSVLRSIAPRAIWLLVLGMILSLMLVDWSTIGPVVAARDAVLNEHMRQQAYDSPPPASDLRTLMVSIEGTECPPDAGDLCAPSPLIDRSRLAELVGLAAKSGAKVIVVDVLPAERETCDSATASLLTALASAAGTSIVILPRGVAGQGRVVRQLPSFMGQCPDLQFPELANVFWGHALLSDVGQGVGIAGAVSPWIIADIPGKDDNLFRRRVPTLSLILAEAMRAASPGELRARFDAWGLETRATAQPGIATEIADPGLCSRAGLVCDGPVATFERPAPLRINFHFGWQLSAPGSAAQVAKAAQLRIVPDRFFNAERSRAAGPASAVVIAGSSPAFGDIHYTPIGRVPGGLIIVNAAFNFDQGGFLKSDNGESPFANILEAAIIVVLSAVLTACLVLVAYFVRARLRRRARVEQELEWAWPVSLLATSMWSAVRAWSAVHTEFDKGLLTFTLITFLFALVEFRAALEELGETIYSGIVGWALDVWTKYRTRHAP